MSNNQYHSLINLKVDKTTKRVTSRESTQREFKIRFENQNLPRIAKTMASFANRDGGIIFFGIKDNPREIIGITDDTIPDDVVITNFLKQYFQPEIFFESSTIEINGVAIHCLLVKPSINKPIMCCRTKVIKSAQGKSNKEVLREGAIYYRYGASSDEIKYAELKKILDIERENFFKSMIDNITLLNKVGTDRAAIVNAEEMSQSDHPASIYLTSNTAKNLNWIDSGRFAESQDDSENAYYVVRKVEIKHGVEVAKPTDFSKTHPLTKTELSRRVKISGRNLDAVTWKLGIKDNPVFHISSKHGKNMIHKFKTQCVDIILEEYPLNMDQERSVIIKKVAKEYFDSLR